MEHTFSYKNESSGYFFEMKRIEGIHEVIFDKGLFRGIWSKSSSGYVDKEGYQCPFGKNQMFFCTPYHNKIVQNLDSELYMFSFSHEFLRSTMINSEFAHIYPLFLSIDFDNSVQLSNSQIIDFEYLSDKLEFELSNSFEHQETMIGILFSQVLIEYQRLLLMKESLPTALEGISHNNIVEKFYLLLEDNFKTRHLVKEYAGILDVSTITLSNAFRDFPISPLKLIHQRIFLEAKMLLLHSDLSIKQVSYELGFQETSHFYHFFKNQEKTTPSQFRATNEHTS